MITLQFEVRCNHNSQELLRLSENTARLAKPWKQGLAVSGYNGSIYNIWIVKKERKKPKPFKLPSIETWCFLDNDIMM